MPWYQFAHAAGSLNIWRCFVLAICVLATKRIPIILALWRWIPDIKTFREAIFSGHFGPIGVGAIFIATLGRTELPEEVNDPPQNSNDVLALTIQPIVFFFVLCSITVHGLTIPFFAFSKRATTITRTWSRHPSFADGGEPGWLNRMRRFRTGDTMQSQKEVEGGGMSEIRRVLDAQLGVIGKGAIGGDAEDELRRIEEEDSGESSGNGGGDSSSGSRTRVGLMNTRTERDLELAEGDGGGADDDVDDLDDWHGDEAEDPACEWGGDDTAEARAYKAKRAAARLERHRKEEQRIRDEATGDAGGDLGEAPMDREMDEGKVRPSDEDDDVRREEEERHRHRDRLSSYGCDSRDEEEKDRTEQATSREKQYPKARSWLEGRKLLIEYMPSRLGEPEVHVVCLDEEEAEELAKQRQAQGGEEGDAVDEDFSAAHAWLATHREELDEHVEGNGHHEWGPKTSAMELVRSGALQKWLHSSGNGGGRRDQQGEDKKKDEKASKEKEEDRDKDVKQDRSRADATTEDWMPRTDTQDSSRRIPGISVSFLNNDDTAHDRAARGNTHGTSSSHPRLSSLLNPFTSSSSSASNSNNSNNMARESSSSSSGGNGSPAISRRTSLDDQSSRQRGEHGAAYPGARTRTHLEREDTPNEGILAAPPSPGGGTSTPSGGGSVAFDKLPSTSR